MANINKIKIGTVDPDAIMFDNYDIVEYKNIVTFGSIVPVDNSTQQANFNQANHSEWQINDGWEVEIISPTRIAIKKFKIDTWGLRLVTNDISNLVTNRVTVRVTGLTYVHNNVVCHTAGSTTPDGFTSAYIGDTGYNVYWYPGQFSSGRTVKGLCIQPGIGYRGSSNEISDSLQMGKHPWDANIDLSADGITKQTWSDGSYRALTIGLFGGVQNATKWHDETGDAYRVYDISDHPIYIYLDGVPDQTTTKDVSTMECWDAYCGDTKVWHKDKTYENYWKKYGFARENEDNTITLLTKGTQPLYVHPIVDLEDYIDRTNFQLSPANLDFWDPIIEYYKNHTFNHTSGSKFYSANIEELELTLPNNSYLAYDTTFKHSHLNKLKFIGQPNTKITSLNGIFEGLGRLETFEIEIDPDCIWNNPYLAGATDCSNMFNNCLLPTYPERFIDWSQNHSFTSDFSVPATLFHSAFWMAGIVNIPAYPVTNPESTPNVIYPGYAHGSFNRCINLETVGPILDLELINPLKTANIFVECTKLNYIRIKHLNHGNWHFDNTEFKTGSKHGTLEALGAESVEYLFNNLTDLNTHDPIKNVATINNSWFEWENEYPTTRYYDMYSAGIIKLYNRSASQAVAPFTLHTAKSGVEASFEVTGLIEGDSLIFTASGDVEPDLVITKNGHYTITKNDTIDKGFKLVSTNTDSVKEVSIVLDNCWDLRVPLVDHANLYCPETWSDKVTSEMISAANAKGWTIYIGGVEVQPS